MTNVPNGVETLPKI